MESRGGTAASDVAGLQPVSGAIVRWHADRRAFAIGVRSGRRKQDGRENEREPNHPGYEVPGSGQETEEQDPEDTDDPEERGQPTLTADGEAASLACARDELGILGRELSLDLGEDAFLVLGKRHRYPGVSLEPR